MKEFLNRFAYTHRALDDTTATGFSNLFTNTVHVIDELLGAQAFRTKTAVNAALFDALTVGVAKRLAKGTITTPNVLKDQYAALMGNDQFKQAISAGTTDEANVASRLSLSIKAFRDVP